MFRQLTIALVTMLAMLGPSLAHADGPIPTFVGCPAGQAIRGINFITRALVCVPVGGDTSALQARVAALETALASAQATIACMHAVGTDVFFDGCNVHVRSGGGATDAPENGLGNLIIGYNEDADSIFGGPAVRTGSHNLVVGPGHTYSSHGGLVAGHSNAVTGSNASVSGGQNNTASNFSASVSGGVSNTAIGIWASVSGGGGNTASGDYAGVSGGEFRSAPGEADWAAGSLHEDK
jgi:hypothetical protein